MNLGKLRLKEVGLVADFLYDLYAPVEFSDFPRHMVRVAQRHFGGDGYAFCFDRVDLATGRFDIELSRPPACRPARTGQLIHQNPSWKYAAGGGKEKVLMTADFLSRRAFERTDFFQEVFKPWGVSYQLAASLPTRRQICGFTFHRDTPIPEAMRTMLTMFYPHILRAHELARQRVLPGAALRGSGQDLRELGLSKREAEVLRWIAQGKRDAEIASILGISRRTVNKHVEKILAKLGAESRMAAVARASDLLGGAD